MTPRELAALAQFDGFPYLNTRLVPAVYHITLLPADAPEATLLKLARVQAHANRLDTCLLLNATCAIFFWSDGRVTSTRETPRGGTLLSNGLALAVDLLPTLELQRRQSRLDATAASDLERKGAIFGDLSKGGRRATTEELERLHGSGEGGAPRGLERCPRCQDWRGECLDPSEHFAGMVMRVHCLCENHNRCARCGSRLHAHRLNANYYNSRDGAIWHVPGFSIFEHRCSAQGKIAVI